MSISINKKFQITNPGLWERWILLFESIVDYYSHVPDEASYNTNIESGFYPPEFSLTDESLSSLYDESFRSLELLGLKPKRAERHNIIQELRAFIDRYHRLIPKVDEIGLPECVLKYYDSFCEECNITEKILNWNDSASHNINSLYEAINGVCVETIPYEHFEGIINNGYYQKIEYEIIPDIDECHISNVGPEICWSPKQNHLFSYWFCILCLKEFHADCDFVVFCNTDSLIKETRPDWVDDCFAFPNAEHFLSIPSHDCSEEDVNLTSQFLGRPMFKGLCNNAGIRSLLIYKSPFDNLTIHRSITNYIAGRPDKSKLLERLLKTINAETLYWEDNIDEFVNEFNDLKNHKSRLKERESSYQSRKEYTECFHLLFLGQQTNYDEALSIGETNIGKLLRDYEYRHTKEMSSKFGLPLLSRDDVYQLIGNCIKSNYFISSSLSVFLANLSNKSQDDSYANAIVELALREKYVKYEGDELTIVKGCMTQLANLLVSEELISPNWATALWAYRNCKELTHRDRLDIAEKLTFRKVDLLFGVDHSKLKKAFLNENKDFVNIIDMLWQKHKHECADIG